MVNRKDRFEKGLFHWLSKEVSDIPDLDENVSIKWFTAKRIKRLNQAINILYDAAKSFHENKELSEDNRKLVLKEINDLKENYDALLEVYNSHEKKHFEALGRSLPKISVSDINLKKDHLVSFVSQLKVIRDKFVGFSTPDVPLDYYSAKSDENLVLPDAINFVNSQESVL